jgi:ATP-dependent protease HslVU (ClpYQ) peptidase subunit
MTTVAYRDGILAGDTRVMSGELIERGHFRKVFRLKTGILLGFAGDAHDFQKIVIELKKSPANLIPIKSSLNVIMVRPDGVVMERDDSGWTQSERAEFYAIGSGRTAALVAMTCGKSAAEAVRIAMLFDPHTGGRVQMVKLK